MAVFHQLLPLPLITTIKNIFNIAISKSQISYRSNIFRNPNSGNLYFDSGIEGRGKFRYLTPRECFLFMGFTDEDFDNVIKNNPEIHKNSKLFPRDKLIRMAGNSIPVKLLEGIFYQIKLLDEILGK